MVANSRSFLTVRGRLVNLVSSNKTCLFWLKIRLTARLLFKFISGTNHSRISVKATVYNEAYSEYILRAITLTYENFFNVGSKATMIPILSIPVLCGMECHTLSDFYINELGHDSTVSAVFWPTRPPENSCTVLIFPSQIGSTRCFFAVFVYEAFQRK